MPDIVRQLAVKTSTDGTAVPYDIGSQAPIVTYTPNSEAGEELVDGTQTTVENALNYLSTHSGGGANVVVVDFDDFSTLPQVKTNVSGITVDSVVLEYNLSNPAAQTSSWTVVTGDKTVTIQSDSGTGISGTTSVRLILANNSAGTSEGDQVNHMRISKNDYDNLTPTEKARNTVYFIEDWNAPSVNINDVWKNEYKDITDDFDTGLFSSRLGDYRPGNFIKKTYDGNTYVALLADYNTFRGTQNLNAVVNEDHWVAIVLGFPTRQINSSSTTANGFKGSAMNTWLKGSCTNIAKAAFGINHLLSHSCLLTTGTYNANTANTFGFNWEWESGHYIMLMSESQIYGSKIASIKTGFDPAQAWRQFKIFQNDPYTLVLGQNYGQSNNNFNEQGCWLRDIHIDGPGQIMCIAGNTGIAGGGGAGDYKGCFPIIMLK